MPKRIHSLPLMLALLAGTALPGAALAETVTISNITGGVPGEMEVVVPTLEITDSSLSEDTVRAIFAKGFAGNADALAALDAGVVRIPELRLTLPRPADKSGANNVIVYKDIAISDVVDGVAGAVTVGGATSDLGKDGAMTMGEMSASDFNIGGLLAFYGLTASAADAPMTTIYRNFSFAGAKLTSPEFSCDIKSMSAEEFRARPLKTSLFDIVALAEKLEGEAKPSPADVGKILTFYADLLTAFESSPLTFDGMECAGKTDKGEQMAISLGAIHIDGFSAGVMPAMSVDGFKIDVKDDGYMQMAGVTSKPIDFSSVIAALAGAPAELTDSWFESNFRKLIPSYGGFGFSGFAIDIPDEDKPGERITAQVADFDLTLGKYVNGIPTEIWTSASGVKVPLPEGKADVAVLKAMGIDELSAEYNLNLYWDDAANAIVINQVALAAEKLGAVALYGTIGNATTDLFGEDTNAALMAAMGLTVKDVQIDLHDDGLAAMALSEAAKEQGQTPEALRAAATGMAQGMLLSLLGGDENAKAVSEAVGAFISGSSPDLSVIVTAKDPNGLTLPELMAAEKDPAALISKVDISAFNAAEGEDQPVTEDGEADAPAATEPEAPAEGNDKAKDKAK